MFIYQHLFAEEWQSALHRSPRTPCYDYLNQIQTVISPVNWNRRNTKLDRTQPHIHRRSDSSLRFSLNACLLLGEGVKGTQNPEHGIYPSSHYVLTIKIRTRSLNPYVLLRAMSICHSLLTVSTQQHCCSLRHFTTHSTKKYTLKISLQIFLPSVSNAGVRL